VPISTFYRHQNPDTTVSIRREATQPCSCNQCNGRRVTYRTALRHRVGASNSHINQRYDELSNDVNDGRTFAANQYAAAYPQNYIGRINGHQVELSENIGTSSTQLKPGSNNNKLDEERENSEVIDRESNHEEDNKEVNDLFADTFDGRLAEYAADINTSQTSSDNDEIEIDPAEIDRDDIVFAKMAKMQAEGRLTRATIEDLRDICQSLSYTLPSLRRTEARLRRRTLLSSRFIDTCISNCIAFTGRFQGLDTCPKCGQSRYKADGITARTHMLYVPLTDRLVLQYQNKDRSKVLQGYRHTFHGNHLRPHLRDVFDGDLYQQFHRSELGLFSDRRDVALQISLDGVQATSMKTFEV
jgi:hypothetical protein